MQDTPGYHEAGAETEAILGFIFKGNVDYMASDMVCASGSASLILAFSCTVRVEPACSVLHCILSSICHVKRSLPTCLPMQSGGYCTLLPPCDVTRRTV